MLTIDDVRAIPLFSMLPVSELEHLARTSADLHLGAGEFAVPEGGDRALYAVLAGKIEVVKLVDGIERTLGWRVPGQISAKCLSPLVRCLWAAIGRQNPRGSCVWIRSSITPLRRRCRRSL